MGVTERVRGLTSRLRGTGRDERPGVAETIALVRRYVLQETVGPLRSLGRSLAFGLPGALVASLGTVFVLVGVLRVLETETGTVFAGDWSFVPYLLTAAAGLVLVGFLALVALRAIRSVNGARGGA